MDPLEKPIDWAKNKAFTISVLNAYSGRDMREVICKALALTNDVYPYAIDVVKYENALTPTFKTHIGMFKNSSEAIQYVSEVEDLKDLEEENTESMSGILQVRRIHSVPKKYSEKDLLASWHFIMKNIKMEVILVNGRDVTITNKGQIARELSRKYGLRTNNYLVDLYKKKYNNGIGG